MIIYMEQTLTLIHSSEPKKVESIVSNCKWQKVKNTAYAIIK